MNNSRISCVGAYDPIKLRIIFLIKRSIQRRIDPVLCRPPPPTRKTSVLSPPFVVRISRKSPNLMNLSCDMARAVILYTVIFHKEVKIMKASYKKLWKLLVDKDMSKGDLHKASGLSSSTMTKLRKSEDVSMEALRKICIALDCNIGDIVEFVPDSSES